MPRAGSRPEADPEATEVPVTAEVMAERVGDNAGVLSVFMDDLLPLIGATYMSKRAPYRIMEALRRVGVDYLPTPLPQERWALVRLYSPATPAGELVRAVLDPTDESDELIRSLAAAQTRGSQSRLEAARSTALSHEHVVSAVASLEALPGRRPPLRVAIARIQQVVALMDAQADLHQAILNEGLRVQAVGRGVKHALPEVDPRRYGFSGLHDLLRCALAGTDWAIAMREAERPHGRLVRRDHVPAGLELLEDVRPPVTEGRRARVDRS